MFAELRSYHKLDINCRIQRKSCRLNCLKLFSRGIVSDNTTVRSLGNIVWFTFPQKRQSIRDVLYIDQISQSFFSHFHSFLPGDAYVFPDPEYFLPLKVPYRSSFSSMSTAICEYVRVYTGCHNKLNTNNIFFFTLILNFLP